MPVLRSAPRDAANVRAQLEAAVTALGVGGLTNGDLAGVVLEAAHAPEWRVLATLLEDWQVEALVARALEDESRRQEVSAEVIIVLLLFVCLIGAVAHTVYDRAPCAMTIQHAINLCNVDCSIRYPGSKCIAENIPISARGCPQVPVDGWPCYMPSRTV